MKSLNKLVALGAVLAATSSFALADTINGTFFIQGNNTYTPTSVTFGTANVGAGQDTGTMGITGSFATFLVDKDAVNFTSPITFVTGTTTTLATPAQAFTVDSTTTSDSAAEILSFDVSKYSASYIACDATNITDPTTRCFGSQVGDTFLNISGSGIFTGEGVDAGLGSSNGTFNYSSQTVNGQVMGSDFSVSANAVSSVTPEPNSLLLLGTGLLAAAGMMFMRRRGAAGIL